MACEQCYLQSSCRTYAKAFYCSGSPLPVTHLNHRFRRTCCNRKAASELLVCRQVTHSHTPKLHSIYTYGDHYPCIVSYLCGTSEEAVYSFVYNVYIHTRNALEQTSFQVHGTVQCAYIKKSLS
jgi:hypothetical protein